MVFPNVCFSTFQSTVGKCNAEKPGAFDFVGKAKWNAWNSLGDMSQVRIHHFCFKYDFLGVSKLKVTSTIQWKAIIGIVCFTLVSLDEYFFHVALRISSLKRLKNFCIFNHVSIRLLCKLQFLLQDDAKKAYIKLVSDLAGETI